MLIISPTEQRERRKIGRRLADEAIADLLQTFSSCYCHSCLDRMSHAVLLLDDEMHVLYATPQVEMILKKHNPAIVLSPQFTLYPPNYAERLLAFTQENNTQSDSFNLLLEGENGADLLLLLCFKLPKPTKAELNTARYMITLRDSKHYPSRQWLIFNQHFDLTPAEGRLCSAFADGLTLNDYCAKWNVAPSTARSQLHNVFSKTGTHRQTDLLRLIFLFTRTF